MQWFRNGEKLKPGKNYKTSISGNTRRLIINKPEFENENGAQYTCRIVENDELTETTTTICFPEISKWKPTFFKVGFGFKLGCYVLVNKTTTF